MATPLNILLIEDNPDDVELLLRELRRGGYEPQWECVDEPSALVAALARQSWHVITCDWVMPSLSAVRALELVRSRDAEVPLIVVSGEVGEEFAVTAMKAGAHDFVAKQRLSRLVPAVTRELHEAETRRARRSAESALAEREAELRRQFTELETIYRTAPVGMAFLDRELRFVRINEILAGWNGLPVHAHIGRRLGEVLARHAATAEFAERAARRVLDTGWPVLGLELDQQRAGIGDGDAVWRADYFPVAGLDGTIIGISALVQDVSDRKRSEARLQALTTELEHENAALERRVTERTSALEVANAELRAFTSSVSHDLRAPLRAISGFADALYEDCAAQLDPQGRVYLDRLRAAARRMGALFDGLLTLSRVMQRELERASVNLSALAEEIAGELQRAEPDRRVCFSIAPDLVVSGDPVLLRAALANLLGNAWKFSRDRVPAHIAVGCEDDRRPRTFFVRDDGAGFDPAHSAGLFRPFKRLHTESEFEGNGVGLTTVQRIIERHGGQVWADAALGQGATFSFTLPEP